MADAPEQPADTPDEAEEAEEELRRKFREALEHKRSGPNAGGAGRPDDGRKSSIKSSKARTQRMFRRKSG